MDLLLLIWVTVVIKNNIVCYHGNHFLNPIFLGSESGCHGNVHTPHCAIISMGALTITYCIRNMYTSWAVDDSRPGHK